jgi:hypothetical protein
LRAKRSNLLLPGGDCFVAEFILSLSKGSSQ